MLAAHAKAANDYINEQVKAVLWEHGELSWKLRPEQAELKAALEDPIVQLVVLNLSRRFGKTYMLVLYAIEQCRKKKQKVRYGCSFRTDLEEFVMPAFALILEDCPPDLRPEYVSYRKTWVFKNGSEIKLIGLDKHPNGIRGNAISIIIIDEAGFVKNLKKIYTSVIIPATAKQQNIKLIFSSTPPDTPDHFFIALIDKAQAQANGLYREMTIDQISDLAPEERQRLLDEIGGEDSVDAQREFFCKLIIDASIALAPEFNPLIHVKEIEIPKYCFFWVSGDTGIVRDLTVFHLWGYDFMRAKALVFDEVWFTPDIGSDVMAADCIAMEDGRKVTRHIDTDARLRMDLAKDHKFVSMLPQKEELEATVNQVRVALRTCAVEIGPKCKLLINTLKMGTLNKQRTDLARTEALGHMDAYMSFAYGLRHINKENPYPAYGGAMPHTHYIKREQQNKTASAFQGLFKGAKQ